MILEVKNATFGYSHTPLFSKVSFRLKAGEILAILGPNGSGKTTLLKCLMRILPLQEGSISPIAHIGYLPQKIQTTFSYDVLNVVLMGRASFVPLFGVPSKNDYQKALNALATLHISHFKKRSFPSLSHGEQQLVMIARSLASDAQVLLCDEPTSALDLHNQHTILRLLRRLASKENKCILFTTHNPQHALSIADKSLLFLPSHETRYGLPSQVITPQSLHESFGLTLDFMKDARGRIIIVPPLTFED
ncbi:ABC transporter ATP-binding protein [Candidatus Woesearchaeota archaeon]|nr:ABC transporter ATP-binding protein [Candidatus Woesearchaeota archaeon]HIH37716.1 ABC transporter ATP-binding protein [Candidatus Woesearchaeota archaeon]HIH48247.1 ABC transporter ATP-binding protein [Candidatus Woesearchaeota archaeon]HIJ03269.1 ABC transporter ATP-binding protein [Candidatus Woesearchaeota archaeon]